MEDGMQQETITPCSRRSLSRACTVAGFEYEPENLDGVPGLGQLFLWLLILGVDHEYVGSNAWFGAIYSGAPAEPSITP